jgi:hypothetical protein
MLIVTMNPKSTGFIDTWSLTTSSMNAKPGG